MVNDKQLPQHKLVFHGVFVMLVLLRNKNVMECRIKEKTHSYVFSCVCFFFLQLYMYCTFCTQWKSVKFMLF